MGPFPINSSKMNLLDPKNIKPQKNDIRATISPTSNTLEIPEPPISKKEIFMDYVKNSGFKAAMVRAIVALFEEAEKADDPHDWLFAFLGYGIPTKPLLEMIQKEADNIREKIAILQQENSELKVQVEAKEAVTKGPETLIDWDALLKLSDEEEDDQAFQVLHTKFDV